MKAAAWTVCLAAAMTVSLSASGAIWLVDADNVSGVEDGTTWATAFTNIQSAVDAADGAGGGQVWVAAGTYTSAASPVVGMADNVAIYGGFAATRVRTSLICVTRRPM